MRQVTSLPITLIALTALASCTSPGHILEVPTKPEDENKIITIKIEASTPKSLEENVVLSSQHTISSGASVVISVPNEYAKKYSENKKRRSGNEYSTDAFFNEAEQQIERSLIQHGFRVLKY